MYYPLASTTWDEAEVHALEQVIEDGQFTMGARVRRFEEEFARYFRSKFAVMTSSGSTANLIALAALAHHPDHRLRPGDEIIVPAVAWSTTYFPVAQAGFRLRFVDIDPDTLNLDFNKLHGALSPRTRAVFAVNLLGNPVSANELRTFCEEHELLLFEDNCESMGATFEGRYSGTFGECGTFSTFFSHHMCTMEGGVVLTSDRKLYDNLLCLRSHGWTRELDADSHLAHDFDEFERKFRFVLPGFNVRPLEMEGALGSTQLRKLPRLLEGRRQNARIFVELFEHLPFLRIQRQTGQSSWFGFSMVLEGKLKGRRRAVVAALTNAGIDCRPVVAGDFTKNPVISRLDHIIATTLEAAADVDCNGLFVGNHDYPLAEQIHRLREVLEEVAAGF